MLKKLILKSPHDLYHLLDSNDHFREKFIPFMDYFDLFLNGCSCDAEDNFEKSCVEYKKLSIIQHDDLKELFNCQVIEWYFEDELIATT